MPIKPEIRKRAIEEGFRLTAVEEGLREKAYRNDPDEPWTIGYGFTYWPNGAKIRPGDTMSRGFANSYLRGQVEGRLSEILSVINDDVEPLLTVNMLTALLSIHHNLGHGQFKGATFVRRINQRDFVGAADAFLWWKRGNTEDDLLPRRKRERALFLKPDGR